MNNRYPPPPVSKSTGIVLGALFALLLIIGPVQLVADAPMKSRPGSFATEFEVPLSFVDGTLTDAPVLEVPVPGVCDLFTDPILRVLCELFLAQEEGSSINWENVIKHCMDTGGIPYYHETGESITFICNLRD